MKAINPKLAKQYIEWFRQHEPFWYQVAKKRVEIKQENLQGLGEINWSGLFSNVVTAVKDIAPTYIQARQQKKIMDMQLDRAAKGLPPANIEDYTPSIKIAPTITPETEQAITRVATKSVTGGFQTAMPWVFGGLIALMLLKGVRHGQ